MSYAILLTTAAALLQPPGVLLLLGLVAVMFRLLGWRKIAIGLLVLTFLGLYLLSTGPVARRLVLPLEDAYPPLRLQTLPVPGPQAIVVLGGGTVADAPDYGTSTLSPTTLARLRAAADLGHATGLPIVLSGGRPRLGERSEATMMAQSLRTDFRLSNTLWIENKAFNTAENANRTRELLDRKGIRRIYLVTSAIHMPRAMAWFRHVEFQVVPVPTDYLMDRGLPSLWTQWLPRATYLNASSRALHEYMGRYWKWLRMQAADPEV